MKKSSYLLILFVVIIWGGNPLLKKSTSNPAPLVHQTKKIDPFSVVVAQPGSKVLLHTQWSVVQNSTFSFVLDKNELYKSTSFGVRNDTLFVFASSSEKAHRNDRFYCNRIKSIVGLEKSQIQLNYFKADTLKVKLNYAKLSGDFEHGTKKSRMLILVADSSKIEFKSLVRFDQINLTLNRSHLRVLLGRTDTCTVTGTMKNYSRMILTGKPFVKVKQDATSFSSF